MAKKILIINKSFELGGIQIALSNMLDAISERYDIDLAIFNSNGPLKCRVPDNVNIVSLHPFVQVLGMNADYCKKYGSIKQKIFKVIGSIWSRFWGNNLPIKFAMKFQKKLGPYDAVISYHQETKDNTMVSGFGEFALYKCDAPLKIAWVHADFINTALATRRNYKTYSQFDKIICVSKTTRNSFITVYPELKEKTSFCYNYLPQDKIIAKSLEYEVSYKQDKDIILFSAGRLVEEKGYIQAARKNGYFSINPNNESQLIQMRIGNVSSIEETFSSHRIYKIKNRMKNTNEYQEEIDSEIHYSNQPIRIPRQIRNYFRGIDKYRKQDYEKYKYFRNACRLYNKSKMLGTDDASIELSFMIVSIEALSKTEGDIGFTNFVMKYNPDATREELDSLYGIRSKLFHAGSFSFFEFEFDVNPFSDPMYFEFQRKYILYKSILRKTIINWISSSIVNL